MVYKRIPHNKTKYIEMGGILSKLTGRNNAIYIINSIFYKYSSNENKYLLKLSTERHSHEQVLNTIKHYEEIKERVELVLDEDIEKRKTSISGECEAGSCLED